MKKTLLLLTLILCITFSYSQCIQDDGTYQYRAILYIENVPTNFDKNDFIDHITGLDNISNEDLTILTNNITFVEKTFPSQNPIK